MYSGIQVFSSFWLMERETPSLVIQSEAKDLNPSTSALQILPPYGRLNDKENNVHFLHVNGVKKPVPFYNLDVLLNDLRKHTLPKKNLDRML